MVDAEKRISAFGCSQVRDKQKKWEEYGLKGPGDRGELRSSGSFAAVRMTAETCHAK
jgi:hypothetical protein